MLLVTPHCKALSLYIFVLLISFIMACLKQAFAFNVQLHTFHGVSIWMYELENSCCAWLNA